MRTVLLRGGARGGRVCRHLPTSLALVALAACGSSGANGPGAQTAGDAAALSDASTWLDGGAGPVDGGPIGPSRPDAGKTDAGHADAGAFDATVPSGDGGTSPGTTGCTPIGIDSTTLVDKARADSYAWSDAHCARRTAALIRNDAADGLGSTGGYLRRLTYTASGQNRTCSGTGTNGWNGFGYIVDHYASTAFESQQTQGKYQVVLSGKHHAIHQFTWRISPGGAVDATVQWVFMTGRDHPLFAITLDATPAGPNVVNADSRSPYGDLSFDNDTKGDVSGNAWGDSHKFTTTGPGPVTPTSPWDYSQPNIIPYDMSWSNSTDSEMGLVATRAWSDQIEGGDYGGGTIMGSWGKTGSKLLTDVPDWDWPYQLDQYELPYGTTSHRVSWGTTYGAVGQSSYTAFGKTLSGYPYQSYTVAVVLGPHTTSAVAAAVKEFETVQTTTLAASRGTVSTTGPAGLGRTDKITYTPPGFDPIYAVWDGQAASNAATFVLAVPSGTLTNPSFRLHGYSATTPPSKVTFGGKTLVADTDYFATVDASTTSLWLTLNLTATGTGTLTVDP